MHSQHEQTLTNWLIVTQAPHLGPINIGQLLDHFGSIAAIASANASTLQTLGLKPETIHAITQPQWKTIKQAMDWQQINNQHIITQDSPYYPTLLKHTVGAPNLLYLIGNPALLSNKQLAIVGSRKPTPLGKQLSFEYANYLSKAGLTITSGLALGIDAAAHQGALACGHPTIAVLGCGVNRIYPKRHDRLTQQISEQGALISEFPLSTPPLAQNFPRRNRIISGLSLGTLVIEAAIRSGSLITAHLAAEQGREVFAMPGSIKNLLSAGTHQLIQQGAQLVTQCCDITEEFGIICNNIAPIKENNIKNSRLNKLDQAHNNLLKYVNFAPTSLDEINAHSFIEISKLNSMLLQIEIHGYIKRVPGGYIKIRQH